MDELELQKRLANLAERTSVAANEIKQWLDHREVSEVLLISVVVVRRRVTDSVYVASHLNGCPGCLIDVAAPSIMDAAREIIRQLSGLSHKPHDLSAPKETHH